MESDADQNYSVHRGLYLKISQNYHFRPFLSLYGSETLPLILTKERKKNILIKITFQISNGHEISINTIKSYQVALVNNDLSGPKKANETKRVHNLKKKVLIDV
jgi:hypothetical protein